MGGKITGGVGWEGGGAVPSVDDVRKESSICG